MDKDLTEIIVITDRSRSMEYVAEEAIEGFNVFLKEQQESKEGRCLLTYCQFNEEYEIVHNGIPIEDMKPLTTETFVPSGFTALLDAMGRTIEEVGKRLANTPEDRRPGNVIVVVITDGQENKSTEFKYEQIQKMVKHQADKYDWSFIYLAQNIDAFRSGSLLGFDANHHKMFVGNMTKGKVGQSKAYYVASQAVNSTRQKATKGSNVAFDIMQKMTYTQGLADDDDSGEDSDTPDPTL